MQMPTAFWRSTWQLWSEFRPARVLLAPAHADFGRALRAGQAASPDFSMTTDGVHLNAIGNARLALTILETLNFKPHPQ